MWWLVCAALGVAAVYLVDAFLFRPARDHCDAVLDDWREREAARQRTQLQIQEWEIRVIADEARRRCEALDGTGAPWPREVL